MVKRVFNAVEFWRPIALALFLAMAGWAGFCHEATGYRQDSAILKQAVQRIESDVADLKKSVQEQIKLTAKLSVFLDYHERNE